MDIESITVGSDTLYWTAKAMHAYGGSFVQSLGTCSMHADAQNLKKLVTAFPEYFRQYVKIGKEMQSQEKQDEED